MAAVCLCLLSYASDRMQDRGSLTAGSCILAGIGYMCVQLFTSTNVCLPSISLLLAVPSDNHVRYFATFCITIGAYCAIGLIISWCRFDCLPRQLSTPADDAVDAHNFGSESKKAAGTPLYMSLGQGGSVLGSHLFPSTEGPRYM